VKLLAHSAALPGNDLLFGIVPLPACRQAGTPPIRQGLRGTLRSSFNGQMIDPNG